MSNAQRNKLRKLRLVRKGGDPKDSKSKGDDGSDDVAKETAKRGCEVGAVRESTRVSRGVDTKANTCGGGGALERGHGASLERIAQLGDALGGVRTAAVPPSNAAERVEGQAAKGRRSVNGR